MKSPSHVQIAATFMNVWFSIPMRLLACILSMYLPVGKKNGSIQRTGKVFIKNVCKFKFLLFEILNSKRVLAQLQGCIVAKGSSSCMTKTKGLCWGKKIR